jgi:Tfp pilus assembly protein PilN
MTTETPLQAAELPHRTQIPALQRWLSFGAALGIEITPTQLHCTLLTVRPGGIRLLDTITINGYRERPASEWGAELQNVLDRHKHPKITATVVLPATDCLHRVVAVPGVTDADLPDAIQFQLDGLHPYPEHEVTHAYARLKAPQQKSVALGIARQPVIEDYATLFDEAGIGVAAFLTPAAAIYSALRVLQQPPADAFLAVHEEESGTLIYSESPLHPLYCVLFPASQERAIAAATAQLRLADDAPQARLASILPLARESSHIPTPLSYSAALAGALPRQSLAVNLLPAERRTVSSPWRWVPTAVLVLLLSIVGLGFATYQEYENRRLLAKLDAELAQLLPSVNRVRNLEAQINAQHAQLTALASYASWPAEDLAVLRELTRLLPLNTYVAALELTRDRVTFSGETEQSMELLKLMDDSPLFADSEFLGAPARQPNGKETFQLRAIRERPKTEAKP